MTIAPTMGFKPLAGIANYDEAMRMSHGVKKNSELLQRYLFLETQLNRVMVAHLTGVPEWEMKQAFSLHQWQDAEHSLWLRERVKNMRFPAPNLDKTPDPRLGAFAEELIRSEGTLELVVGIYQVAKAALLAAYKHHLEMTNPVADYTTVRWLRFIIQEEEEQIDWGKVAFDVVIKSSEDRRRAQAWADHLNAYLAAAGGVSGENEAPASELPPARATKPFEPERTPARDSRFPLLMHYRGPQPKPEADAHEMNAWTVYKLLTEMHAPEMLALYSYDVKDMPWEFYRDVGRHLWDECRHSMMGQVAFERDGLDWTKVAHDIGFALFSNTEMTPEERYVLLVAIEQRLMAPTGKATQYGYAVGSGDEFSRQCNDYDWADEVLHVQIGRKWLREQFPDMKQLMEQGLVVRDKLRQLVEDNMHMAADPRWWDSWYARLREKQGLPPKSNGNSTESVVTKLDINAVSGG